MGKTINRRKGNEISVEEQKIVTKYDRKMQKRKEEAIKAAKQKKITLGVLIAVAVCAVVGCIIWAVGSYNTIHKEYIKVNDESVSGIEFDFYYGVSKNENLSQTLYGTMTYGDYFTSYLGYDSAKSDKSQAYSSSTEYTWYDYFANSAVNTIKEYRSLLLDAEKNGFVYEDFDTDYEKLQSDLKTSADEAGVSLNEYYKTFFGKNATQKSVKPYIEEYLKATAYEKQLRTELAASDDEIKAYYEENKDTYDQVTYRQFVIAAETKGDEAAMSAAKEKAEAMMAAVTDESTFAEQCRLYATEDEKDKYASDDGSLLSDTYKSSVDSVAADWVFDSARAGGDVTVIEDADNSKYYVLYYVSRKYDESNDEKIADTLLNQNYSELISGYTETMKVDNIKNRIKMLKEK